ncbi:zinc ribbon domain-containing protein [Cryobacterium glucosi]|uniref:Recombinase zinc beta ribbon domain-containing protein n=1 Tax=Cryobacterium glucosi TaxID=1259175 RepID=A0ABY2INR0_9MICO|nr:hypothetical protein E3O46_06990 [Cryobacterium glucosi]
MNGLLSGLAVCGVCGSPVHAGVNARTGIRTYLCSASTGHLTRNAEPIEVYVRGVVIARLSVPDAHDVLNDPAHSDVTDAWDSLTTSRQRVIVGTLMRVTLFPPGRGTRTFRPETVGIEWLS